MREFQQARGKTAGKKNGKGDGWWWERVSQGGGDPGIRRGKVMRSTCEKFFALYFYWKPYGLIDKH